MTTSVSINGKSTCFSLLSKNASLIQGSNNLTLIAQTTDPLYLELRKGRTLLLNTKYQIVVTGSATGQAYPFFRNRATNAQLITDIHYLGTTSGNVSSIYDSHTNVVVGIGVRIDHPVVGDQFTISNILFREVITTYPIQTLFV